jgi:hypothetical protein
MDFSFLLTPPVITIAVALVVVSAWVGYAIGKSHETKRKALALAQASAAEKAAVESLRKEHDENIALLNEASTSEIERLKQVHREQIDQLNQAHRTMASSLKESHSSEIERLSNEHNTLIDRLNAANIANINELKQEQERQLAQLNERSTALINEFEQRRKSEIQEIKTETAETIAGLRNDHQSSLQTLRQDHEQAIAALQRDSEHATLQVEHERDRRLRAQEERNAVEVARLTSQISELSAERDRLNATVVELDGTVTKLQNDIKEAKLSNMFSVSRSGEKLIHVVRSVQELASELDETSRTVTGGDYSFLDEIKDQRDKETVLSLTGGGGTYAHTEAEIHESSIDVKTEPAADQDTPGDTDDDMVPLSEEPRIDSVDEGSDEVQARH